MLCMCVILNFCVLHECLFREINSYPSIQQESCVIDGYSNATLFNPNFMHFIFLTWENTGTTTSSF